MPREETCKTCKHCCVGQVPTDGWCRLRKIRVHREIALFAFCHHWTQRPPVLPNIQESSTSRNIDKQLDFARVLVTKER